MHYSPGLLKCSSSVLILSLSSLVFSTKIPYFLKPPSIHINLGLPLFLFLLNVSCRTSFIISLSSILITCQAHLNLDIFVLLIHVLIQIRKFIFGSASPLIPFLDSTINSLKYFSPRSVHQFLLMHWSRHYVSILILLQLIEHNFFF